jgi:hypothetical protein
MMGGVDRRSTGRRRSGAMRRTRVVLVSGFLAVGLLAAVASPAAGSAGLACPADPSGRVMYPIHGTLGDPAPAPGAEPLWDIALAGAEEEGLTVEELAESFGLDVNGLYTFALGGWLESDKNGDRNVCVKEFPPQNQGQPAYFFNFKDNNTNVVH